MCVETTSFRPQPHEFLVMYLNACEVALMTDGQREGSIRAAIEMARTGDATAESRLHFLLRPKQGDPAWAKTASRVPAPILERMVPVFVVSKDHNRLCSYTEGINTVLFLGMMTSAAKT